MTTKIKIMSVRGPVVVIINQRHRHHGEKAVVQWSTPKFHYIRLLKRIPTAQRFGYDQNGNVFSTSPINERLKVAKASVKRVPGETAEKRINTWQPETGRLLKKHSGWTRDQIEAKYGKS